MDKEQIIALAEKADETATQYLQCAGEYHPDYHSVRDEHFYHAAIESYKADLLKGVGEPVLYAEFAEDGGWLGAASEYADHLEEPHALFTSYQVAAAIIKATKPLEERRCEVCGYAEHHREHTSCLRIQLAKAEQLLQVAQGRCDGLEEKLAKAEQRVAEACARVCREIAIRHLDEFDEPGMRSEVADKCNVAITQGEWRKFVKEV